MERGAGGACGERGRRRRVRLERPLALLAGEGREIRDVRREPGDLEWHRSSTLERPLKRGVVSGYPALPRNPQCFERLVPRRRVGARERPSALLDLERLRGDARRVRPRALRAPRDHRDEARGDADRERRGGAAAGRLLLGRDLAQEVLDPELQEVHYLHE